ncbi:hypothetical protein MBT84_38705 [Streptomyces sp. MBT84]|nr:hypothetical protein [Streptomyces sp. MBT84]
MSSKQIGQLLADDEASFLHVIRVRRHPSGLHIKDLAQKIVHAWQRSCGH